MNPTEPPMWVYGLACLVMFVLWIAMIVMIERAKYRNRSTNGRLDGQTKKGERTMGKWHMMVVTFVPNDLREKAAHFQFHGEDVMQRAAEWLRFWSNSATVPLPPVPDHPREAAERNYDETDEAKALTARLAKMEVEFHKYVQRQVTGWAKAASADAARIEKDLADAHAKVRRLEQEIATLATGHEKLAERVGVLESRHMRDKVRAALNSSIFEVCEAEFGSPSILKEKPLPDPRTAGEPPPEVAASAEERALLRLDGRITRVEKWLGRHTNYFA